MSLRRTLVSLQIAFVVVGLAVFGVASYQLYRHAEVQRLHDQLRQTDLGQLTSALCDAESVQTSACPGYLDDPPFGGDPDGDGGSMPATSADGCLSGAGSGNPVGFVNLTPGSFAELRSSSGRVLARLSIPFAPKGSTAGTCPDPDLPARVSGGFSTVRAVKGPGPFLVTAELAADAVPGGPGYPTGGTAGPTSSTTAAATTPATTAAATAATVVVVGVPLTDLETSLHHLLVVELVVGAVLLLALAAGSLILIRRSLRPLERMAATSRAIAAGDLSRRVPAGDGRSEVGQLGAALNGMLGGIERAFAERDATELRLRQFLADASHELRTPLTSIRGYAELWRMQERDGRAVDGTALDAGAAMARIEEHAVRMGGMIEELLLLARLDDAHLPDHSPVDLVVVAAEACDDATALEPGRPVSLDATEDVGVLGDRTHLRRAVTNLVTNAVRHTPPGTPIEVGVHRGDGVATVVVRDHGPGLSDAGLAHAFDRFWQADTSRATGGSGLGLAIVAGVAAEHGGAATVANAPDGGAVLTLRLPLPRPDAPGDPAPVPPERADGGPGPR